MVILAKDDWLFLETSSFQTLNLSGKIQTNYQKIEVLSFYPRILIGLSMVGSEDFPKGEKKFFW